MLRPSRCSADGRHDRLRSAGVVPGLCVLQTPPHTQEALARRLPLLSVTRQLRDACPGTQRTLVSGQSRERRPRAGDTSVATAITRPTTGQNVHAPWNQCWTAVYQISVVGRKMNPSTGHSAIAKIPRNQLVNSQSTTITSLG